MRRWWFDGVITSAKPAFSVLNEPMTTATVGAKEATTRLLDLNENRRGGDRTDVIM
jgi:hypothetical protein